MFAGFIDVVFNDAPDPGIVFFKKIGDVRDRHFLCHEDDQTIHEKRKATLFSCPRDLYLMDPTTFTVGARYPTVEIAFMLEKVQMTPDLLGSVIGLAPGATAHRTNKR